MKRLLCTVLALLFTVTLSACGKPSKTSDAMYQIGINALDMVDDYIGGKITGTQAKERIDEFSTQAKAQYEQDKKDIGKDTLAGTDLFNDSSIQHYITMLSFSIGSASRGSGAMSKVAEDRDNLAVCLGKKNPSNQEKHNESQADLYTYDTEDEIQSFIEQQLAAYGVNVYINENDNGLSIDCYRKTTDTYVKPYFAEALKTAITATVQAKERFDFELSELSIAFLMYKNSSSEEAYATLTFKTENLNDGMLIDSLNNHVKSSITVEEAIELLN